MARTNPKKPSSQASTSAPPVPKIDASAPLFTQENFEKELQALASKAQEETTSKWILSQARILIQAGFLLSLAALYSTVSQLTLSPVYGGYPSAIWHAKGVMTALFLGWSSNLYVKRYLPVRKPVTLLPLLAAYIPVSQYFLFQISGILGARYGPIITESLTLLPLIFLSVSCTATILDDVELTSGRWPWISDAAPGIFSFSFFKGIEYFAGLKISSSIGQSFFQTRLGYQILMPAIYTALHPSKLALWMLPAAIHTAFFNIHVPTPYATARLNSTMNEHGWALLERKESITGYISVIENLDASGGFRAMRCDHSVLGGEWLDKFPDSQLPEPIYSIFVMLEAIRLVEVPKVVKDEDASALVIGLGIGTTPAALISHGIHTTIVEIDPVVYDFALKYFTLPLPEAAIIEDAVTVAHDFAAKGKKFNYIVHDVFTGGAEPVALFTKEFLEDLNAILMPGGVIAINYAGDFLLPPFRIILHTIRSIFPLCRIYRESAPPSPSSSSTTSDHPPTTDFTNMVIFCLKPLSPLTINNRPLSRHHLPPPATELTFRDAVEGDFLGSRARSRFLMPKWEVDEALVGWREGDGDVLRANETDRLKGWQGESARGHWDVMRGVLPGEVWVGW